ncbi:hypothetical protein Cgig2_003909 [Carnegiea gigantea]|uniref:Uncharacterized protein n=1 Tax=Carnegiea gigantea TaxID=171969 RepID=A0A9Q1GVE8_9CARY|nr:hypothetical protein Cgig2_003909 [Carnegiea gigantea]
MWLLIELKIGQVTCCAEWQDFNSINKVSDLSDRPFCRFSSSLSQATSSMNTLEVSGLKDNKKTERGRSFGLNQQDYAFKLIQSEQHQCTLLPLLATLMKLLVMHTRRNRNSHTHTYLNISRSKFLTKPSTSKCTLSNGSRSSTFGWSARIRSSGIRQQFNGRSHYLIEKQTKNEEKQTKRIQQSDVTQGFEAAN